MPERPYERRARRPLYWLGVFVLSGLIVSRLADAGGPVANRDFWNPATTSSVLLLLALLSLVPVGFSTDRRIAVAFLSCAVALFFAALFAGA